MYLSQGLTLSRASLVLSSNWSILFILTCHWSIFRRGDDVVELAKESGAEHVVMMSPAAESVALVSQMDR